MACPGGHAWRIGRCPDILHFQTVESVVSQQQLNVRCQVSSGGSQPFDFERLHAEHLERAEALFCGRPGCVEDFVQRNLMGVENTSQKTTDKIPVRILLLSPDHFLDPLEVPMRALGSLILGSNINDGDAVFELAKTLETLIDDLLIPAKGAIADQQRQFAANLRSKTNRERRDMELEPWVEFDASFVVSLFGGPENGVASIILDVLRACGFTGRNFESEEAEGDLNTGNPVLRYAKMVLFHADLETHLHLAGVFVEERLPAVQKELALILSQAGVRRSLTRTYDEVFESSLSGVRHILSKCEHPAEDLISLFKYRARIAEAAGIDIPISPPQFSVNACINFRAQTICPGYAQMTSGAYGSVKMRLSSSGQNSAPRVDIEDFFSADLPAITGMVHTLKSYQDYRIQKSDDELHDLFPRVTSMKSNLLMEEPLSTADSSCDSASGTAALSNALTASLAGVQIRATPACGLRNNPESQVCAANSVVQTLYWLFPVRRFVLSWDASQNNFKNSIDENLRVFMQELQILFARFRLLDRTLLKFTDATAVVQALLRWRSNASVASARVDNIAEPVPECFSASIGSSTGSLGSDDEELALAKAMSLRPERSPELKRHKGEVVFEESGATPSQASAQTSSFDPLAFGTQADFTEMMDLFLFAIESASGNMIPDLMSGFYTEEWDRSERATEDQDTIEWSGSLGSSDTVEKKIEFRTLALPLFREGAETFADLYAALDAFTEERVGRAGRDHNLHEELRRVLFTNPPPILTLQLSGRVVYDRVSQTASKNSDRFDFPLVLKLHRYHEKYRELSDEARARVSDKRRQVAHLQAQHALFEQQLSLSQHAHLNESVGSPLRVSGSLHSSGNVPLRSSGRLDVSRGLGGSAGIGGKKKHEPISVAYALDIAAAFIDAENRRAAEGLESTTGLPVPDQSAATYLRDLATCARAKSGELQAEIRRAQSEASSAFASLEANNDVSLLRNSGTVPMIRSNPSALSYRLHAVVCHSGQTANIGHYWVFVRDPASETDDQEPRFFRIDDEIVEIVTTQEMFREALGGDPTLSKSDAFPFGAPSAAYIVYTNNECGGINDDSDDALLAPSLKAAVAAQNERLRAQAPSHAHRQEHRKQQQLQQLLNMTHTPAGQSQQLENLLSSLGFRF